MDLKVHITMYNAENMIQPCLGAALKVLPGLTVHDFGSEDNGPYYVEQMNNITIDYHGRLSGEDYVKLKEQVARESKYTFWIDADEVWPEESLRAVVRHLEVYSVVNGYWRNLKVRDGKILMCEPMHRGAIAWDSTEFRIHREWPWEKLDTRGRMVREQVQIDAQDVWCYHGVLLNVSNLPDKKNRWKKRAHRDDECKDKVWQCLPDLPFPYKHTEILEKPKFVWYK